MPRRILIIDEKPFMLRLIQHHLERAGYKLIKARNRQEAMEAIAKQSPELVVMDDNGDAQKAQAQLETVNPKQAAHSIPVIRMTDVPQGVEMQKNVIDAEVILTKPFSPTHLVAEVKRLVPEL
jgi:two-component system, OmpR family, alkaline phosphatase synthesis response regulator PhoP